MPKLACLTLCFLPLVTACSPAEGSDHERLRGTWQTVRLVTNDKETPFRPETTVTFENGQMITRRKGKQLASWSYTLDETKNPRQMVINTGTAEKPQLSQLIYKIEGDTLTTCSGSRSFPKEFTTKTEQGCFYTVRQRVKE